MLVCPIVYYAKFTWLVWCPSGFFVEKVHFPRHLVVDCWPSHLFNWGL